LMRSKDKICQYQDVSPSRRLRRFVSTETLPECKKARKQESRFAANQQRFCVEQSCYSILD
ncbi:MAG: hypothetical protein OXB90_07135, partial [Acidimicrobiaceae bacterium]|nr:hypothetical protein [Acidimicrobiaceae bacterium]